MATEDDSRTIKGQLRLALHDAAKNCAEHGAIAQIVLRSGFDIMGKIENRDLIQGGTVNLRVGQGWMTVDTDEIAAVGVQPRE